MRRFRKLRVDQPGIHQNRGWFKRNRGWFNQNSGCPTLARSLRKGGFHALSRPRIFSPPVHAERSRIEASLNPPRARTELDADYLYTFDQHQRKLAQTLRLKLN